MYTLSEACDSILPIAAWLKTGSSLHFSISISCLPDGRDAWLRVDDGFIQSDTPVECIPREGIEYPDERTGNWEEKVNKHDALDAFEPADDPLLVTPPLYDHQGPRRVKFADKLEDFEPSRS
eukprot:2011255-Amphidinium_carterae.2